MKHTLIAGLLLVTSFTVSAFESDTCEKLNKKAQSQKIWIQIAIGMAAGLSGQQTAYSTTRIGGETIRTTVNYTDRVEQRRVSDNLNAAIGNMITNKLAWKFQSADCPLPPYIRVGNPKKADIKNNQIYTGNDPYVVLPANIKDAQ